MQSRIDAFFRHDVRTFNRCLAELDETVGSSSDIQKDANYDRLVGAMRQVEAACQRLEAEIGGDAALLRETQQRFCQTTAVWIDRSWIGRRARTKPRGYPGDYALLNAVYDDQPKSPGVGGYIDLYLLNLILAHSVRARWQELRSFLLRELARRHDDVAILNVACGPFREFGADIRPVNGNRVRVNCLDNDREALDFVTAKVVGGAPAGTEIVCQRYNALRMKSSSGTIRNFGKSDIIYSIGLCDYIDDDQMIGILKGWRESLKPGGVLLVAFKDCTRYDKTPYEWFLDWRFYQRTENDCRALFQRAGFDMLDLNVERDTTRVIMNFISRAPAASAVRFDIGEIAAGPHVAPDSLTPADANAGE